MYDLISDKLHQLGIIPVVRLDDANNAVPLAKALCQGGLPCAEVTFRTAAAEKSIANMSATFPDMLIGAGTVLTINQVQKAITAGATFIVSPGFNPEVVGYCIEHEIPIFPGCMTPSEIERAISFGLDVVKFFPAEAAGGIKMIKALAGPYVDMKFIPTGGINTDNIENYLGFSKVIACGGSWMVKDELIAAGDFEEIAVVTAQAVRRVSDLRSKRVNKR
jgi:2-dehydro-3-deoxyphosphogluconate aldolase/(4S)-4-hydroxy-2-oxoglutarate aldolase